MRLRYRAVRAYALACLFFLAAAASVAAQAPEKVAYSTTVFFVTDQEPIYEKDSTTGLLVLTGFREQRYANWIGQCVDAGTPWSETCGLRYGFVQWDSSNQAHYSLLSYPEFAQAIGKPARALIFFHGFNEHFDAAIKDGYQFASWLDYTSKTWGDTAVIVYGWPASSSAYSRAAFYLEYPNDETNNVWTRTHLRAFFRAFRQSFPTTRVTLIGHSMGNQLTLDLLLTLREEQLQASAPLQALRLLPPAYRVAHLIALEPDVDTQTYAESIKVLSPGTVGDITVYGNFDDVALGFSRDLHAHCRAGLLSCEPLYDGQFNDPPSPMPATLNVIDAHNVAWKCDPVFGHTYYRQSGIVLQDITGIVLDKSSMMTQSAMRLFMSYGDTFGKVTAPHFWIIANKCLQLPPDPPRNRPK